MDTRSRGRPRLNFEEHKDILYRLYITKRQLLEEIRQYMKDYYNFQAGYT